MFKQIRLISILVASFLCSSIFAATGHDYVILDHTVESSPGTDFKVVELPPGTNFPASNFVGVHSKVPEFSGKAGIATLVYGNHAIYIVNETDKDQIWAITVSTVCDHKYFRDLSHVLVKPSGEFSSEKQALLTVQESNPGSYLVTSYAEASSGIYDSVDHSGNYLTITA